MDPDSFVPVIQGYKNKMKGIAEFNQQFFTQDIIFFKSETKKAANLRFRFRLENEKLF